MQHCSLLHDNIFFFSRKKHTFAIHNKSKGTYHIQNNLIKPDCSNTKKRLKLQQFQSYRQKSLTSDSNLSLSKQSKIYRDSAKKLLIKDIEGPSIK